MTDKTLQEELIHALIQMQKIPGMEKVLQPSIHALENKTSIPIHVPENDYKNISAFKDLIFKKHQNKIKTAEDKQNTKALLDLTHVDAEKKQTSNKKKKMT
jgi:hypothetical protein